MSSIPQTTDNGNSVSDFATKYMKRFQLGSLLFKCNTGKEKRVPVMEYFHITKTQLEELIHRQLYKTSPKIHAGGSGTERISGMKIFYGLKY